MKPHPFKSKTGATDVKTFVARKNGVRVVCQDLNFIQIISLSVICSAFLTFPYLLYRNQKDKFSSRDLINELPDIVRLVKPDLREKEYPFNLCSQKYNKETKNNVLSYSLFGKLSTDKTWLNMVGSVADEAKKSSLYRDWQVRIHHDGGIPNDQLKRLEEKHGNLRFCDARKIPRLGDVSKQRGKEWRYIPIGDRTVDIVCIRNLQNVLLQREYDAVEEWMLRSYNKAFHCMYDRVNVTQRFEDSGTICYRNSNSPTLTPIIFQIIQKHQVNKKLDPARDPEEILLQDLLWPYLERDTIIHDSYTCRKHTWTFTPFPTKRYSTNGCDFIGCSRLKPSKAQECPLICRPRSHRDWKNC